MDTLPMQPIHRDSDGMARFQENLIVRYLLDNNGRLTLNDLAVCGFPQRDWEQFYQLIGYSLSGYHELSNVSDVSALEATEKAQEAIPGAHGCRDDNCSIHCGVEREA